MTGRFVQQQNHSEKEEKKGKRKSKRRWKGSRGHWELSRKKVRLQPGSREPARAAAAKVRTSPWRAGRTSLYKYLYVVHWNLRNQRIHKSVTQFVRVVKASHQSTQHRRVTSDTGGRMCVCVVRNRQVGGRKLAFCTAQTPPGWRVGGSSETAAWQISRCASLTRASP